MTKVSIPSSGVIMDQVQAEKLWEIISTFPMPFGPEYLEYKEKWTEEFGEIAIAEYRRYIFLAYISEREVTPSETVDEVWHYHILHTVSYERFARACGRFLHHLPGMPSQRPRWNRQYLRTHRLYNQVFGETARLTHWPIHQPVTSPTSGPDIGSVLSLYKEKKGVANESR